MKHMKLITITLSAVMLLSMTGCSFFDVYRMISKIETDTTGESQVMTADGYDIQVTMDGRWEKREDEENPYDLQCIYNGDEAYASFFYFYYIDLASDTTAADIFDLQVEDVTSKRDHVKVLEETSEKKSGEKTIRSMMFEAERDGAKNYYYANLVEFGDEADQFAWVMFTSVPSDMMKNREVFDAVLDSLEYTAISNFDTGKQQI